MTAVATRPTVFGRVHLGYVVIESEKLADWRRFGRDGVGMHLDEPTRDTLRFRLDEHRSRFLLRRGPAEDVTAIGWHIDDHTNLEEIARRARERGVPVTEVGGEQAQLRGVERLLRLPGPKGLDQEIFTRAVSADEPLSMRSGGFVTGAGGLGHLAVTSRRPHQLRGYFDTLLDARLTDYIDETISGVKLKIRFLRMNERHHSVAIAAVQGLRVDPIRTRVQHVNIQVAQLDDMTDSYQRIRDLGFGMALGVGQHTNDRELSYYARTPSGFEWEVGWNPLVIDENTWNPNSLRGISIWGHTPMGQTIVDKFGQFATAVRSLARREDTVPALSGAGIRDHTPADQLP